MSRNLPLGPQCLSTSPLHCDLQFASGSDRCLILIWVPRAQSRIWPARAGGHRGRERALSCLPPGTYRIIIPHLWSQTTMLTFLNTAQLTLKGRPEEPESIGSRHWGRKGCGPLDPPQDILWGSISNTIRLLGPSEDGPWLHLMMTSCSKNKAYTSFLQSWSQSWRWGDLQNPFLEVEYEAEMLLKLIWITLPVGDGRILFKKFLTVSYYVYYWGAGDLQGFRCRAIDAGVHTQTYYFWNVFLL